MPHDKPRASPTAVQPFRGASLPAEMVMALKPALETFGPSRLAKAMVLAWHELSPQKRAALLATAEHNEDAIAALRSTSVADVVSAAEVAAATKQFEQARAEFPTAMDLLTADERFVAQRRFVPPGKRPPLEDLGAELGGATREWVRQLEERAHHKLSQWLIALMAGQKPG